MALEFAKKDAAAYISHLDLQRAFSRAIRRSGAPVKLSEGFQTRTTWCRSLRHWRLGIPSECECVEMQLTKEISPGQFFAAMRGALPPGLAAKRAARLKDGAPKLMAALHEAAYTAKLENADLTRGRSRGTEHHRERNGGGDAHRQGRGEEDRYPAHDRVALRGTAIHLSMRLSASQNASLRPDVLLGELRRRAGGFWIRGDAHGAVHARRRSAGAAARRARRVNGIAEKRLPLGGKLSGDGFTIRSLTDEGTKAVKQHPHPSARALYRIATIRGVASSGHLASREGLMGLLLNALSEQAQTEL